MPAFGLGIWRPHCNLKTSKSTPNFHFQILFRVNPKKKNDLAYFDPKFWGKSCRKIQLFSDLQRINLLA
jgi:hypothetical protein